MLREPPPMRDSERITKDVKREIWKVYANVREPNVVSGPLED
jgi:hypothetical protein